MGLPSWYHCPSAAMHRSMAPEYGGSHRSMGGFPERPSTSFCKRFRTTAFPPGGLACPPLPGGGTAPCGQIGRASCRGRGEGWGGGRADEKKRCGESRQEE